MVGGAPTEMASEMSIEECSEKDPIEKVWMEETIDNPKKDLRSSKMVILVGCFLASTAHVGPSDPMSHTSSTGEIL